MLRVTTNENGFFLTSGACCNESYEYDYSVHVIQDGYQTTGTPCS